MVSSDPIEAIRQHGYPPEEMRMLRQAIESGHEDLRELASVLVGEPVTYGNVKSAMSALEQLANHDLLLSLVLMVGLYEIADPIGAHDISDGIELWLENMGTTELDQVLNAHRAKVAGTPMARKLTEWMSVSRKS